MLKLFLTERVPDIGDSILLSLLTSDEEFFGGLFQKIPTRAFKGLATFVDTPGEADYLMVPHNYSSVASNKEYLLSLESFAAKHKKTLLVFAYGDSTAPITLKHSLILRTSAYKSMLGENEIMVPAFVEDLGEQFGLAYRKEKKQKPTVSFAGWVTYRSLLQECKYQVKVLRSRLKIMFGLDSPASFQGIYYRRKALRALSKSQRIVTNFLLRTSYSGNKKTIEGDQKAIREEFVSSIQDADLILSVRGDGNWSLRFYEVLSLGRIPLYVDTDAALPFEDEINYGSCTISLDYADLHKIADIASEKWEELSVDHILQMQKKAREIFETKLRADVFYKNLFTRLKHDQ